MFHTIFIYLCADLTIDVPDFLDLSRLRATGLQADEEELPDLMPPIVLPEDTRGACYTLNALIYHVFLIFYDTFNTPEANFLNFFSFLLLNAPHGLFF